MCARLGFLPTDMSIIKFPFFDEEIVLGSVK